MFWLISFSESQSTKIISSTSACLNHCDKDSLGRVLSNFATVNLKMKIIKATIFHTIETKFIL